MLAERYGTVGELRAELENGDATRAPHRARRLAHPVTKTVERSSRGSGSSLGDPWHVIVLNDNHNSFDGVAAALRRVLPGVSFDQGMRIADTIHATGRAIVWSGHREVAEMYWTGLRDAGLTMAPLEQ